MHFGKLEAFARRHWKSILAFWATWLVYGFMTNANDLHNYGLYQIGAESIVDFQTFTVGHSHNPEMRNGGDGDVFSYQYQNFIAKQPGAFLAAAVPYAFLKIFGYDYEHDYRFIAAVSSWFTAGLLTALSVVALYHFLLSMGFARAPTLITSVAYAFGTTIFPYTGVPHHDVIAGVITFFSFILLFQLSSASSEHRIALAGMGLGTVLFFSMLPALMVATMLVYALYRLGFRKAVVYGSGFVLGNVPLFIYNGYYFDGPFRQANMAGGYDNTFFHPGWDRLLIRMNEYFGIISNMSATRNMPVFVLALVGILFLKPKLREVQWLVVSFIVLQLGYLFSIGTEGHCQFGPRYLIPLIPFVMIGFPLWFENVFTTAAALATLLISLWVNGLGALGDSMQCANLVYFPATHIWEHLGDTLADPRPLLPLEIGLTVALALLAGGLYRRAKRVVVHGQVVEGSARE